MLQLVVAFVLPSTALVASDMVQGEAGKIQHDVPMLWMAEGGFNVTEPIHEAG